ncbi:class I SAM-dependent methyltransferase [Paenarthrobacter nitroguajacolicus]|uniref:class I SAM-dependent methyltransferase n=1 Tax=Paenarthrobacter nitroguajacolicus TaxID=211146 RepID=UPI0015C18C68|nr:class I SAM-dependent methyltransferase [Paenarthrobacter nitroguajacolicus]NWL11723.1 class I SAM-dependent methyltransferase [Paenarthrobacter nitroguajacolicus]
MLSQMTGAQLSALYDAENQWAEDDDFFLAFVNERPNGRVLDLGCGTGRMTLAVAADGHAVVGVDPNLGSLAAARTKPGAQAVTWIEGTSAAIPNDAMFDVAIMTAHVAQAINDDGDWSRTLTDVYHALIPGGRLVFDSRDPAAMAWQHWVPANTRRRHTLPDGCTVETWAESAPKSDGLVALTEHRVVNTGTRETETSVLAFRTEDQLRKDLKAAGFTVDRLYGGWHGEQVGNGQGELIVIAHKPI